MLYYVYMSAQPLLFDLEPEVRVPRRIGQALVTRRRVRQILTKPTGALKDLDFTINPYVGCSFACSYCYAAFFMPDEQKAHDWGYWVEVKENALELLRREDRLAGCKVLLGSVTDPYQPVERDTGLTKSIVEHLSRLEPQPSVRILTRSPLVSRDIDIFRSFHELQVGMSITTDDDATRIRYEPSCASIGQRLSAVKRLTEEGIRVTLNLAPLLPVTNVNAFAQMIRDSGASGFWASYFHPGTRKFAAGTRPGALQQAKMDDWCFEKFIETAHALKGLLPDLARSTVDADSLTS